MKRCVMSSWREKIEFRQTCVTFPYLDSSAFSRRFCSACLVVYTSLFILRHFSWSNVTLAIIFFLLLHTALPLLHSRSMYACARDVIASASKVDSGEGRSDRP